MTDQASAPSPTQVTREGFERLQAELEELQTIRRPELVGKIQRAKLFLDPTIGIEIATVAARDLELVDQQIERLEALIKRSEVVDAGPASSTTMLGSRVTVRYDDGTDETLAPVGLLEADLSQGYFSSESPAGKVLLGEGAGDEVDVDVGGQTLILQIDRIGSISETA
jgi:transcription elongation factor GreA